MTEREAMSNGRSGKGTPVEKELSISLRVLAEQNSVMGRIKECEEKRGRGLRGEGTPAKRNTIG